MSVLSPLGDRAWIGPRPSDVDARSLMIKLRELPGVEDVVLTEERIAIYGSVERAAAEAAITNAAHEELPETTPTTHVIRVRYDGEDLAEVARATSLTEREVIDQHTQTVYDVRMIGFLPGFAYLGPVSDVLRIPRRTVPRVRVPAGAVGIAAHYTGIYPFASAGGWNLIGRTVDFAPWDSQRGATLAVGDRVRFEAT